MSFSLSSNFGKSAGKVLVAILLASTATACSSDTTRFGGVFASRSSDQITTGSINRGSNLNGPDGDPVPGADVAQSGGYGQRDYSQQNAPAVRPYPNSPARYNPSYSSARVSTAPVAIQRSDLAAPMASTTPVRTHVASRAENEALAQPFPAAHGNKAGASRMQPALAPDSMPTGTIRTTAAATQSSDWTAVNAPSVTLHSGENIDLLARRYGVPAKEILKANSLKNAASAQPGQQIIIPTMNGAGAPSPAKVASEATDLSKSGKMPGPIKAPEQDAVVLPSNGQVRGKSQAGLADPGRLASGSGKGPKPKGDGIYVVKPGDSIARIAKNAGVTVDELKQANRMQPGSGIHIGQTLKMPHAAVAEAEPVDPVRTASIEPQKSAVRSVAVPAMEPKPIVKAVAEPSTKPATKTAAAATAKAVPTTKVAAADPASTKVPTKTADAPAAKAAATHTDAAPAVASAAPTQSVSDAEDKSDVSAASPEGTGIGKYRWPVRGAVVAGYGTNVNGSRNDGIDISVPEGTPIKAAENGVVIYAGNGLKELGNTVLVRHDDGTVTVYGHADALSVTRGQKVQRGQTLATSGMSGDVKQPQLHFEVRKNSAPVNPMTFLE